MNAAHLRALSEKQQTYISSWYSNVSATLMVIAVDAGIYLTAY